MRLDVFADPVEFLEGATAWLMVSEAENNLILGLTARAVAEAPADPWFAMVRDGDVGIACAWQTIPSTVGITRVGDERGIPLLVGAITPRLNGSERLVGPEPEIEQLVRQVAGLLGVGYGRQMGTRLHMLRTVSRGLPTVGGELRRAGSDDMPVVLSFVEGFQRDLNEGGDSQEIAARKITGGQIYLWFDEGEARSMAAWDGPTPNGVRINYVYTPEEHRGRGYATACVAGLTRTMLREGKDHCVLYTDLANPTSNSIYRKIGYRGICDTGVYRLDAKCQMSNVK